MKLSFIQLIGALLAAAGAHAQLSGCAAVAVKAIPSCAQSCFIDNAPAVGCGGFDFACQCQKEAAFFAAIESCVASSCASSLFQDVIDGAALVCECANPPIGSGGSMTVSGTVVPGTVAHGTVGTVIGTVVGTFVTTPTATATTTPESTFQTSSSSAPASTAVPSSSTNGGGSGGTPTASQSFGATASTVSAANRHLSFEVGLALSAFTAMLAFLTL